MRILMVLSIALICTGEALGDWETDFSTFDAACYYLESNAPDCAVWEPDQQRFRLTCHSGARYGLIIQRAESPVTNRVVQHQFEEFSAEFVFKIDGTADGIVFIWSDEPMRGRGMGGSLGWDSASGYGVELDCHRNLPHNDPSGSHIALMHDGIDDHLAYADVSSIQDGNWHTVSVYKSGTFISVHYDGTEVFNYTLAEDEVTSGQFKFSAATGSLSAGQYLDSINITCAEVNNERVAAAQTSTWSAVKMLYR